MKYLRSCLACRKTSQKRVLQSDTVQQLFRRSQWLTSADFPTPAQATIVATFTWWFATTDGRWLIFCRYTAPNKVQKLLIEQLGLELPAQSPPQNHILPFTRTPFLSDPLVVKTF
jgi:hypothetical protein